MMSQYLEVFPNEKERKSESMKKKNKIIIISIMVAITLLIVLLIVVSKEKKKNKLLPGVINSVTIEYYPFYNIETAESLNSFHDYNYIEKQIIQLSKEEISTIKNEIDNIYDDSDEFSKCQCLIIDNYKMIINDEYELIIDKHWGQYKYLNNSTAVYIPDNLYEFVLNKVEKNNTKISKTLDANKITLEKDGKTTIINDDLKNDFLNKFTYLEVNIEEDYLTYDDGYVYVLYFDNHNILYLYSGCDIGYLVNKDSNQNSYVHTNGITKEYIENILSSINEINGKDE